MIHNTTLWKASLGLIAALVLVAPAQAAGWSDNQYAAAATSGSYSFGSPELGIEVSGDVVSGSWSGNYGVYSCPGQPVQVVDYVYFTLVTDRGTISGSGAYGAAAFTWNGVFFTGTYGVSWSGLSPGAWTGTSTLYLASNNGDLGGILELTASAGGSAGGTYNYGQC